MGVFGKIFSSHTSIFLAVSEKRFEKGDCTYMLYAYAHLFIDIRLLCRSIQLHHLCRGKQVSLLPRNELFTNKLRNFFLVFSSSSFSGLISISFLLLIVAKVVYQNAHFFFRCAT